MRAVLPVRPLLLDIPFLSLLLLPTSPLQRRRRPPPSPRQLHALPAHPLLRRLPPPPAQQDPRPAAPPRLGHHYWRRKVDAFSRFFSHLRIEGLLSNDSRALCVGARLGQEVAKLRLVGIREDFLSNGWHRDWCRKVDAFACFFSDLRNEGLLSKDSSALCVGARQGQEVAALRLLGVRHAVGIDLEPALPLVLRGDFHAQPFGDAAFDFEFSNVFDHALYPDRFAAEIERTLRPDGVAMLHVAVHRRGDKYSANDLLDVDGLLGLFRRCEVVRVSKVDAFGLDTEVILRKKRSPL